MMRTLLIAALLGAAGTTATYHFFPLADRLGSRPVTLSRDEAIVKARAMSRQYGRIVDGWTTWVEATFSARTYEFLRTAPKTPLAEMPRAFGYGVYFVRGPFRVRVEFTGQGRPVDFWFRDGRQPDFTGRPLTAGQERQVLDDFAGPVREHFRQTSSVDRGVRGHVTTWEWADEDAPELIQNLEVTSSPDGIQRATMRSEFSSAFVNRWLGVIGESGFRLVAMSILFTGFIGLTNALFFSGLARGQIRLRPALKVVAALLIVWAIGFFGGVEHQSALIAANAIGQPEPERLLRSFGWALAVLPLFAAMWSIGRWVVRKTPDAARWYTLDSLIDGRWFRREVGWSVACGLALGAALTAIPAMLGAAGGFGRPRMLLSSPSALAAWSPAAMPLAAQWPWDLSPVFFLLVPLAATQVGRKRLPGWIRWLLVAALAVLIVMLVRNPADDLRGNVVTGALLAAGFFGIYRGVDLLATLAADIGYGATLLAVFLLRQASPEVQAQGWTVGGVYLGVAVLSAAVFAFCRPLESAAEEDWTEIVPEREALRSEFAMAREAQQRLLPIVPPRLDGFSLSASCHPARDVGGDLYDFFRFTDGTFGLCVADVSGKGVPAALYMTMTKGILAAASRDPIGLPELASVLNAQIYAAARKKTFVTMALGRLDTGSRTLEYLRAGHNAILCRRAESGFVCRYHQPRGVGLGLVPGRTFDRTIEVERLSLSPGDVVVFYSDGITEAMNASRELFGEERLEQVVSRSPDTDATGIEQAILREVRAFMAGEPPHDDMTLLVLKA